MVPGRGSGGQRKQTGQTAASEPSCSLASCLAHLVRVRAGAVLSLPFPPRASTSPGQGPRAPTLADREPVLEAGGQSPQLVLQVPGGWRSMSGPREGAAHLPPSHPAAQWALGLGPRDWSQEPGQPAQRPAD